MSAAAAGKMSGFEAARTANELPGVKKAEERREKLHKFDFFIMTSKQATTAVGKAEKQKGVHP